MTRQPIDRVLNKIEEAKLIIGKRYRIPNTTHEFEFVKQENDMCLFDGNARDYWLFHTLGNGLIPFSIDYALTFEPLDEPEKLERL